MELRHLRYFVAVAEELNFTRAAKTLHLAQPSLTRQIHNLEEELGVRLLDRSRNQVSLTEEGRSFLVDATRLVALSLESMKAVQRFSRGESGQLNLGYLFKFNFDLLPTTLTSFYRACPDIAVNLFDMAPAQQLRALEDRKIDLGFIGLRPTAAHKHTASLFWHCVAHHDVVVVLPAEHPLAKKGKVKRSDLKSLFFVAMSEETHPGIPGLVDGALPGGWLHAAYPAGRRPRIRHHDLRRRRSGRDVSAGANPEITSSRSGVSAAGRDGASGLLDRLASSHSFQGSAPVHRDRKARGAGLAVNHQRRSLTINASLINNGTVEATYQGLTINSPTCTNNGTLSASNGATLYLETPTLDNTNGIITAADLSSSVYLNGVTVTGGTLSSANDGSDFSGGGYFNNSTTATLDNVTLAAGSAFYVSNPITLAGTLINNGYFFLSGFNFNTEVTAGFTLATDATLAGTGMTRLGGR